MFGKENFKFDKYDSEESGGSRSSDVHHVENVHGTRSDIRRQSVEDEKTSQLSHAHRDYLTQRHGTVDLEPVPEMDDADPYNWPKWKKVCNLTLVAGHAMMATFTASAIQSAFADIAQDLQITIQQASYLTSLFIAIIGAAPFIWRPLADRYGRRPIFIISLLVSVAGNVGCANSPSYATMAVCRAITALFICPASAIGSAVVAETFFKKDRAKFMGIWTLMVTLGVPLAPFLMGFVAYRVGYRWIYYTLACANAVQLLLYLFLGPESRYLRHGKQSSTNDDKPLPAPASEASSSASKAALKREYLHFGRIDPTPLRIWDFLSPLGMLIKPCVCIPAFAHSTVFLFAIFISIEIPQLFVADFRLDTEQVGLQYLALAVGSVIGEQISALTSDRWMSLRQKKNHGTRPPHEFRLWLSYPAFCFAIVGFVVFLVQMASAVDDSAGGAGSGTAKWNITPLIGAAIMYAGNQIVTTTMITYAVDCYRDEAASVGCLITLVRQLNGFIGPFWFPAMIHQVGLRGSAGVGAGVMLGVSVLPTAIVQMLGRRWR